MRPISTAIIAAGVAFVAGCSPEHASTRTENDVELQPMNVEVQTARVESISSGIEVPGTVRAAQRAVIAARVMGTIEKLPVVLGQKISKGELLARISAAEISARVSQSRSQLNQAERDLAREQSLLKKKASTEEMVRNLEDKVAMTRAMVTEAEVMLGYTKVLAPFDGVVSKKIAEEGDFASPGMPLLELETQSIFEIDCGVPDSLTRSLEIGSRLTVELPSEDKTFSGTITEISPSADSRARSVSVRISVPATIETRSGQFARVHIRGAPAPALLIPITAISTLGQMERVFVVQDGHAVLRLVKTGGRRGDLIEILSGVSDGESVIMNPPGALREGQPLTVQP